MSDLNKRDVFIIGAKSIGHYGGYETFVNNLILHSPKSRGGAAVRYHVAVKANGTGCMNEHELDGVKIISDSEFLFNGVHCFKIHVPAVGAAQAIWYDVTAINLALRYCRKHHITRPVFYVLACRIGPFIGSLKRRIDRIGGQLFVNPDGHEWMRAKWSPPVRRYWKYSEGRMVKAADLVICDSEKMEEYIREEYSRFSPKTRYISYGADTARSVIADDDPRFLRWLEAQGVSPGEYYLVVCRFVPENSVETIISEFMRSRTSLRLVLIMTQDPHFQRQLQERLGYERDGRIRFAGTLYDREMLKKVRENAHAYIHGHTVGGTNPGLLEAMASTEVNLLRDVPFNREVGQDAALYWNDDEGCLSALIERADAMPESERTALGSMAHERIREAFTWEQAAGQYFSLFTEENIRS